MSEDFDVSADFDVRPAIHPEGACQEAWDICADCGTYERLSKLNQDGLCFWCTPEGKAKGAEMMYRGRDIIPRQPHEGALR